LLVLKLAAKWNYPVADRVRSDVVPRRPHRSGTRLYVLAWHCYVLKMDHRFKPSSSLCSSGVAVSGGPEPRESIFSNLHVANLMKLNTVITTVMQPCVTKAVLE
jgi:hypothetical protein